LDDSSAVALDLLRSVFGYEDFRSPQDEIIATLIDGRDALVLMPTGGGKSLCYQIPALARRGCGVVISPLIALMADQVGALKQLGIRADYLNSTLDAQRVNSIESALLNDELDLIYLAPERLNRPQTRSLLKRANIALFAIDEAHCVSQWGHDFRADYLQLDVLHKEFPSVPRIALTATADARTRKEIALRLALEEAREFVVGFDRPNIRYRIALKRNPRQQLLSFLRSEHENDAGIVYCMSRNKTEEIADFLTTQGFNALPYHAGLSAEVRAKHQSRFLREDNLIMVATIAFGMGIDKPDVRFVAHLDLPKTIEAYYQETGRAGRDGAPATAWMVYGLQDVIKLKQMQQQSGADETHRRAEHHRLNAMLGLCEITSCRRQALLNYFGETTTIACGNCDNCLEPVDTWDATQTVRMALSCIYRTGQRFGVNHLIDVLCGADNERIHQFGHHQLSVYGLGKSIANNQWQSVFRQLVARGLVEVDVDRFGALQLTDKCRAVLRGDESIELRRDDQKKTPKRQTRTALPTHIDIALWEALRETRRELADEQGVPPYVIFHDSTLQEMCTLAPRNREQFGRIAGVGARKLEKYADYFLRTIATHNSA